VRGALEVLPSRERRIVELRFGFRGEPLTLDAIGQHLGLTRERVRQLERRALGRMRAATDASGTPSERSDGGPSTGAARRRGRAGLPPSA
jgi:DNA-directed RNA polymerase sigma subunit (sigma70/sigma32)